MVARLTDKQMDRERDNLNRQMEILQQTDRQIDGQTGNRLIDRWLTRRTDKQRDRQRQLEQTDGERATDRDRWADRPG